MRLTTSSLLALAFLLAPSVQGADRFLRAPQKAAKPQPKQATPTPAAADTAATPAAGGKKKALPNAFDSLNGTVTKFKPHFLPVDDKKLLPRVSNYDYHDAIGKTWEGMKARTIDPYDVKLLHRPRSETPDDAVSEGVGYGMLWALYTNDQEYFNMLWDSSDKYMWNGKFNDWRVDKDGVNAAKGAATDAEQDIAICLVFADHLVQKGHWEDHKAPSGDTYADRAQKMLDAFFDVGIIQDAKFVAPGAGWGGRDFVNPGYFSPAYYRVFAKFDANKDKHDWDSVVDQCYSSIENNVGAERGLIPDWMTPDGKFYQQGLGYNAYLDGHGFFKDAIRTHWRIATDYAWHNEPRAKTFLENAYKFLEDKGGPSAANFFTMEGEFLPKTDMWEFDGGKRTRHRYEHSHLTTAMWATAAWAAKGPEGAQPYSDELLKFYENGDYWGNKVDPTGFNEDTDHNEMYFDQFLAFFGSSLLSGYFVDITQAV